MSNTERSLLKASFKKAAIWGLPLIGSLFIRLLSMTIIKRYHLPQSLPQEPIIFAFWHADILMEPYNYMKIRDDIKIKLLISEHFDGEMIAKTISYFGFGTIRGSSRKGGAKVLIQALKYLSEGYDIGITPDGPKGPRYSVSDGIVIMAQKRNAKVVVLNSVPSRYWQLSSWDRFVIPKPFSSIDFYTSEPIDISGLEMDEAKELIRERLMIHAL